MTTPAEATSVRNEIVVDAPIERAFAVFTEQFGRFKPREHNMLGVDIAETVFEPRVGGHIYDRGVDGSECRVGAGAGLRAARPRRVQLGHQPALADRDRPGQASEVEVRFIAETPERTRVELEHRHLDRHGDGWEGVRDGVAGDDGWPLYLGRYADLV